MIAAILQFLKANSYGVLCNDLPSQIIEFRESLELPENIGLTHCESHAIKGFVTRLIRMHDGTRKRETLQHYMKSSMFLLSW